MASRSVRSLCCLLTAISGLAYSQSVEFPNSNTIPLDNGQRAKIVAVRSIDYATKSASVVIDARDRFGTPTRINATAQVNPTKFKNYVKQCLNAKVACLAAVVITELLIAYGASINPDGTVVLPGGAAGSYPNCISKPMPWNTEGGVVTAFGPIPCAIKAPNGNADFYTFDPMPQQPIDTPQRLSGWVFGQSAIAENRIYYRNPYFVSRPEPFPSPTPSELTEAQIEEAVLKNPEALQHAPGKYPDIWKSIPVPPAAKDTDIGTEPNPDPENPDNPSGPDEPEPPAEMIDLSQIPTINIDVSKYLTTGSGWLPKECPPPVNIPIFGRSVDWNYSLMCDVTNRYVSAIVMLGAVFFFLRIVVGGLDRV